MSETESRDRWVKNDMVFICDGIGYCVTPLGGTVCIGPVDDDGNPLADDALTAPVSVQAAVEVVTKIDDVINITDKDNGGILLQPKKRGRPRKTGDDISRMTTWRRQQEEKQGVLI